MKSFRPIVQRFVACGLIISLWALPCIAQGSRPEETKRFKAAVVELRKVKTVASTHTGVAGVPSLFGEVSLELLKYGTEEDFLNLLKDKSPVVRSMGLYCLAQKDVKKHADVLKKFVEDKERIRLVIGCEVRENATVGEVARLLLDNPRNMNSYQ